MSSWKLFKNSNHPRHGQVNFTSLVSQVVKIVLQHYISQWIEMKEQLKQKKPRYISTVFHYYPNALSITQKNLSFQFLISVPGGWSYRKYTTKHINVFISPNTVAFFKMFTVENFMGIYRSQSVLNEETPGLMKSMK